MCSACPWARLTLLWACFTSQFIAWGKFAGKIHLHSQHTWKTQAQGCVHGLATTKHLLEVETKQQAGWSSKELNDNHTLINRKVNYCSPLSIAGLFAYYLAMPNRLELFSYTWSNIKKWKEKTLCLCKSDTLDAYCVCYIFLMLSSLMLASAQIIPPTVFPPFPIPPPTKYTRQTRNTAYNLVWHKFFLVYLTANNCILNQFVSADESE